MVLPFDQSTSIDISIIAFQTVPWPLMQSPCLHANPLTSSAYSEPAHSRADKPPTIRIVLFAFMLFARAWRHPDLLAILVTSNFYLLLLGARRHIIFLCVVTPVEDAFSMHFPVLKIANVG